MIKRETAIKMAIKALAKEQQRWSAESNLYCKTPWKFKDKDDEFKANVQYKKRAEAIKWLEIELKQKKLV